MTATLKELNEYCEKTGRERVFLLMGNEKAGRLTTVWSRTGDDGSSPLTGNEKSSSSS